MMKEKDGRSKGCAFIRFAQKYSADMAAINLNGTMSFAGAVRALVVKYADLPEPRASRSNPNPTGYVAEQTPQPMHPLPYSHCSPPQMSEPHWMIGAAPPASPGGGMHGQMMGGMRMAMMQNMVAPVGVAPVMVGHHGGGAMELGSMMHPGITTFVASPHMQHMQHMQMQ